MYPFVNDSLYNLVGILPDFQIRRLKELNWFQLQKNVEKRLSVLDDDWKDLLTDYIRRHTHVSNWDRIKNLMAFDTSMNVLKRAYTELARVYSTPAKRKYISANGEADIAYSKLINTSDLNAIMPRVNLLALVCNLVLVHPFFHPSGKLCFQVLTPDQFQPIQDVNDPTSLAGIIYTVETCDSPHLNNRKEIIYYIGGGGLGDEPFYAEREGNIPLDKVTKLPFPFMDKGKAILPFGIFRTQMIEGAFINRTAGDDLYQGTLHAGWLLSLWEWIFRHQSFKQWIAIGPGTEKIPPEQILDPTTIIQIPGDKDEVEIKVENLQVDVQGLWDSIRKYISQLISNYGISMDRFSAVAQSGLSLKLQNESLLDKIKTQQVWFSKGEQELANIIRVINNNQPGAEGIDPAARFSLEFGALPFSKDPWDNIANYLKLLEKGVITADELKDSLIRAGGL